MHRFPCSVCRVVWLFTSREHRTESCQEEFQWDGRGNICGLKERGWVGRGTEDMDQRHTNTSLCSFTADGEGQICSVLPAKPRKGAETCRMELGKGQQASLLYTLYKLVLLVQHVLLFFCDVFPLTPLMNF
ncbi:hypothetical protein AMECASPLE_011922 [Ameca splendens]|uniref:Uncharacterized protein n=1 Tax=Ameca splendens TaxID=208324 RepID=A0ABV0ZC37_9TELE